MVQNFQYLGFQYLGGFYVGNLGAGLVPANLQFYRTSVDNNYVFWWTFPPSGYLPILPRLVYELQIDTTPHFNSSNLEIFRLDVVANLLISSTAANIFSANTIGNTGLTLTPNLYAGFLVQITAGTGAGQIARIVGNTTTTFTTEFPWNNIPDNTSIFQVYQSNVQVFQNGNVAKGFQVQVPDRLINSGETLYARVRTLNSVVPVGSFCPTLTFQLLNAVDASSAEALITGLPDYHIYNEDVVKLPLAQRNTLLWNIMAMYGKEYDRSFLLKELVRLDNYLKLTRDENLFDMWGTYFNFRKPTSMQFVDYRNLLKCLVRAALVGSTDQAIIDVIDCFTGVGPLVAPIRDVADFFLTTIREEYVTTGTTNTYLTSQAFLTTTLQLVRVGPTTDTVLTPGIDYSPMVTPPGFTTLITDPAGNTLTAFYDISEPEPLIFDPTDSISLSGTIGLTHGNAEVFGTGTTFTSSLQIGDQITDGQVWDTVHSIASNIHLTLDTPWPGNTEQIPLRKLRYTDLQIPPNTLWDQFTEAFGCLITVFNPAQFTLDSVLIEQLVGLFLPSHVKVFYEFK